MLSLAARSASAVWNSRQPRLNRTQKRALVQLEPARPAMAAHAFLGDSDQPGTRWSMGLPYAEATGSGGGGRGSSNSGEGGEGGGEGGGTPLPQPAPVSRPKSARALSSMGIADLVAVGAALAVPITWAVRQEALLTALDVKLDTKLDALDNKLDTKLDALDNKLDALGNQMSTMDNNLNTKIAALDAKLTKVDLLLCVLASFATLKLGQRLGLL